MEMGWLTLTISPWKASISSPIPSINYVTIPNPVKLSATFSCLSSKSISGIPGRDRVVDFGKYKGKMLGSLPSTYLKWVSKNLRAGDMEEWAKMADQVLDDPVYRDRIEWEEAEKILNGDTGSHGDGRNAVTELLEISKRFGWDNEDKRGWSRIDFGLLGTSKSGRIPRVGADQSNDAGVVILKKKTIKKMEGEGERRRERRARVRQKTGKPREEESVGEGEKSSATAEGVGRSLFPGREALLKKVLKRQGFVDL